MNAKTLEAITRHGESLLKAFPNCTEKNPVALCKKLRRIETSLTKPLTDYCNGVNITSEELDKVCDKAIHRVCEILFGKCSDTTRSIVHVNRDPRGYALKLDDEWTRAYNADKYQKDSPPRIYTDMGGYGILAPDLTEGAR